MRKVGVDGMTDTTMSSSSREIRVLLLGPLAERAGRPEIRLPDAEEGLVVRDLLARVEAACPALAPLEGRVAVAVDARYAGLDARVTPEAEVALVPPVSGG